MSRKTGYFKIGIFVIIGFVLVTAGVIFFGAGKFFRKRVTIETYFDQSVQGLDVGAPLKFQGVPIGNVSEIAFVFNYYRTERDYVLVRAEIFPDLVGPRLSRGKILDENEREALLNEMTDKGLRLELASQGVTGLAFLNMTYVDPRRFPIVEIDWEPDYFFMPSAPGTITVVTKAIEDLTETIRTIDIKGITDKVDQLLTTTNRVVEDAQVPAVSQDIRKLVAALESNSRNLNSILQSEEVKESLDNLSRASENLYLASEEFPKTVAELNRSLLRFNRFTSSQRQQLDMIFEDITQTSESLKELTDTAKRYPSWVFFGDPPPRRGEVTK